MKSFHGYAAPGLMMGGFMVDLALSHMPEGVLFDAVCETRSCLPDAVQLLTPCTVGNGWLRILNLGRYALSLYDKYQGDGVRVYVDAQKLRAWPEVETWMLKLKPKKAQDHGTPARTDPGSGQSDLSGCSPSRSSPSISKAVTRGVSASAAFAGNPIRPMTVRSAGDAREKHLM